MKLKKFKKVEEKTELKSSKELPLELSPVSNGVHSNASLTNSSISLNPSFTNPSLTSSANIPISNGHSPSKEQITNGLELPNTPISTNPKNTPQSVDVAKNLDSKIAERMRLLRLKQQQQAANSNAQLPI